MAFLGAVSLLLSALGFLGVALLYRRALRELTLRRVMLLVTFLGAALTAMFYTVGDWPVGSVVLILVMWVVISAILFWGALVAVRRLAPNNSFKPKPLRGSA